MKILSGAVFLLAAGVFLHVFSSAADGTTEVITVIEVASLLMFACSVALAVWFIARGLIAEWDEFHPSENEKLFEEFLNTDESVRDLTHMEQRIRFLTWKRQR